MESWTPAQRKLARDLLGVGENGRVVEARPEFPAALEAELEAEIEERLVGVAAYFTPEKPLWINKRALSSIFKCEGLYLAERDFDSYTPSPQTLRGRISHEATQLIAESPGLSPPDALDYAIRKYSSKSGKDADYLQSAPLAELAELRALANGDVVSFFTNFPLLPGAWSTFEYSVTKKLLGGRVVLNARYDFVMGKPVGRTARRLIVDLKTGRAWPLEHRADLHFYALVETLVSGVPPFRTASFYMESATADMDDIDSGKLRTAARRLVDGAEKIAEVGASERAPALNGNPACSYCAARDGCDEGIHYLGVRVADQGDEWAAPPVSAI